MLGLNYTLFLVMSKVWTGSQTAESSDFDDIDAQSSTKNHQFDSGTFGSNPSSKNSMDADEYALKIYQSTSERDVALYKDGDNIDGYFFKNTTRVQSGLSEVHDDVKAKLADSHKFTSLLGNLTLSEIIERETIFNLNISMSRIASNGEVVFRSFCIVFDCGKKQIKKIMECLCSRDHEKRELGTIAVAGMICQTLGLDTQTQLRLGEFLMSHASKMNITNLKPEDFETRSKKMISIGFPTSIFGVSEMSCFVSVDDGDRSFKSPIFQLVDGSVISDKSIDWKGKSGIGQLAIEGVSLGGTPEEKKVAVITELPGQPDGKTRPTGQTVTFGQGVLYKKDKLESHDKTAVADFFTAVDKKVGKSSKGTGVDKKDGKGTVLVKVAADSGGLLTQTAGHSSLQNFLIGYAATRIAIGLAVVVASNIATGIICYFLTKKIVKSKYQIE